MSDRFATRWFFAWFLAMPLTLALATSSTVSASGALVLGALHGVAMLGPMIWVTVR